MKKNIIIAVIVAIIVGASAFYGGTIYEKSSLNKQGLLRSAASFGNRQGGQGGQNGQGGPGFNRSGNVGDFTTGEIISKDDKSITVKTRDGSSKIIFFSDSTSIGKTDQGSAADLATGQQVMASGKSNSDGTLAADNIQIRPAQPDQQN